MTYEQAYKDHQYLWKTYGAADDMTGGYVDQEDLDRLLKSPTKAVAKLCLCRQIDYWFQVGPDDGVDIPGNKAPQLIILDPIVREIAERHGCL